MKVTFRIRRFNPEADDAARRKPYWQEFTLDNVEETDRVLELLHRIKWEQDGTLTLRRACAHGTLYDDAAIGHHWHCQNSAANAYHRRQETDEKTKPGSVKEKLDENTRIELLQNALVIWHNLFSSRAWNDGAAKKLWDEHIVKLSGHTTPDDISEDSPENKGTIKQKEKQKKLYDVAKALSEELAIRKFLYNAWRKRWEEDDEMWKKELRWFKDWVLPPAKILLVRKSSVVYSFSG